LLSCFSSIVCLILYTQREINFIFTLPVACGSLRSLSSVVFVVRKRNFQIISHHRPRTAFRSSAIFVHRRILPALRARLFFEKGRIFPKDDRQPRHRSRREEHKIVRPTLIKKKKKREKKGREEKGKTGKRAAEV